MPTTLDDWFDTPFYYILYSKRDDQEARDFINNLTDFLKLKKNASVLDTACGRGRHSKYLSDKGYQVLGIDISNNSISYAKKFENDRLSFSCHDMAIPLGRDFDLVTNFFTSFGYSDSEKRDLQILESFKKNIKSGGTIVIDYMNVNLIKNNILDKEIKRVQGIDFHLKKYTKDGSIHKEISFEHQSKKYFYKEQVKMLSQEHFTQMLKKLDLSIVKVFGNYKLDVFDLETSERLIMIIQ